MPVGHVIDEAHLEKEKKTCFAETYPDRNHNIDSTRQWYHTLSISKEGNGETEKCKMNNYVKYLVPGRCSSNI